MFFQEIAVPEKKSAEHAAKKKTSRIKNPQYNVVFGVFIILIVFIFIQTFTSSLREKDEIYEKVIAEREKLMQFSSTILTSADFNFFNSHKKHVVMRMAEPSDILFCRIVKPTGEIYLSSVESETGKQVGGDYLEITETVTTEQEWNGQQIEVMITPTYREHTLWLGYDYSMINSDIRRMILNQLMVSVVLTILCIIFYVLLFKYNSRLYIGLFKKRLTARLNRITGFVQKGLLKKRGITWQKNLKTGSKNRKQGARGSNEVEANLSDAADHSADQGMDAAQTITKFLLHTDAVNVVLKEIELLNEQAADMDNICEELKKLNIQAECISVNTLAIGSDFETNGGMSQRKGEEVSRVLNELMPVAEDLRCSVGTFREGLSELSAKASQASNTHVLDIGAVEEIFSELKKFPKSIEEIKSSFESISVFISNIKSDKYELFEAVNSITELSEQEGERAEGQGSFIEHQIEKIRGVYLQAERINDMIQKLDNVDESETKDE